MKELLKNNVKTLLLTEWMAIAVLLIGLLNHNQNFQIIAISYLATMKLCYYWLFEKGLDLLFAMIYVAILCLGAIGL
tara:strand:+ start:898 stop:1128 length:231 start_codon:yes stop_codon:yes gene_type:complete